MALQEKFSSFSEDDEKGDVVAATSVLQQRANDVRNQRVNWQSYLQSQMINQEDYNFIVAFDNAQPDRREIILRDYRLQCAKTFMNLLGHISKDQTIQYILTLIDDMLQEDKCRVEIFKEYAKKNRESVWTAFINLLTRPDGFIVNMTSRIISKIACWSKELMDGPDLHFYLTWLKDQLRMASNEYIQSSARCLQMMLRTDEYRLAFVGVDGITTLVHVLDGRVNFQIQYQLTFCLWVISFNPTLAEKMQKFKVVPILADILSESVKEKVTRIILAVLRNLLEKPEDSDVARDNAIAMVQCKVLKQLDILQGRKFDDPDIIEDIEFLNTKLQESVQDLSSFDEYSTEVKSGRLEWSPVHKSAKFWRENAMRLNEKNYALLKILVTLLESSKDPLVLSVAAHDIGEYVRHYPRGKNILEQLGGKQIVMHHLIHEDPNVRYESLLAVQKLMVHNWEYLGKQLEKPDSEGTGGTQVSAKAKYKQNEEWVAVVKSASKYDVTFPLSEYTEQSDECSSLTEAQEAVKFEARFVNKSADEIQRLFVAFANVRTF
uniref:ATPase V1 complex subunit H C-terminal domain-containing protein n=1 Tax=Strigamia maritima TaxID=126957 RepID=T1JCY2_STRMM